MAAKFKYQIIFTGPLYKRDFTGAQLEATDKINRFGFEIDGNVSFKVYEANDIIPVDKLATIKTGIEDRIKFLNQLDAEYCITRWNMKLDLNERLMAREMSNEVTKSRQELEEILKLF